MSGRKGKNTAILAKALKALSEEEQYELLELLEKKERIAKKETHPNKFLEMDLSDEDQHVREVSKKLAQNTKKSPRRPSAKFVTVTCGNCGKEHEISADWPGGTSKFVCCLGR